MHVDQVPAGQIPAVISASLHDLTWPVFSEALRCWHSPTLTGWGEAVKSTASPPGKICGQRCVASPGPSLVSSCGVRPAAGIREKGDRFPWPAMIYPSSPQLRADRGRRGTRQSHRRAALDRDFLQFSSGEEPDPLAVGREERIRASSVPDSSVASG